MNRIGLLWTLAVMIASSPSFAQYGGMGGAGGSGMAVGMMGGGFGGPDFAEVRRSVQIEMEGGQRLSGNIDLRPVIVDADLGQYAIAPDKIKMIRFLKPEKDVEAVGDGEPVGGEAGVAVAARAGKRGANMRAARGFAGGMGGGFAQTVDANGGIGGGIARTVDANGRPVVLTRGKVVTTMDKEVIGTIHIPTTFRLDLDFGSLNLAPGALRSITFTAEKRQDKPAPAQAAVVGLPEDAGRIAPVEGASPPRYFRHGSSIIVISPVGDRVTLFDLTTKKSQSMALSGSKDAPLEVTPIFFEDIVALKLKGSKITRIVVADTTSGVWHSEELHTPFDGQAVPIIAPRVVVYNLGREVYAYSAWAQRWDVAKLPEGARVMPLVGPGTATIDSNGHIYTFTLKSGKWEHIDVRALLDVVGAEKK